MTISNSGAVFAGTAYLGYNASASNSTLALSGGSFTANNLLEIRNGAVNFNGGSLTANLLVVTNNTAGATNAFFNFNHGTLTTYGAQLVPPDGANFLAGNACVGDGGGGNNTITLAGGSLAVTNAGGTGTLNTVSGTLNINSGTVDANFLQVTNNAGNPQPVVNFNGGTLRTGGTLISNGVAFAVGDGAQSATLDLNGGTHTFADGLTISSNATLTGTGTLVAPLTLGGGATLSPGHSPGLLVVSNNLTLADNSAFLAELAGYAAGSAYDQLIVTGPLTNNDALLTVSLRDSFTPTNGAQFVIMDNASSGMGFFSGAPEGSTNNFGSSTPFSITYAGGADSHDIILTAIPEQNVVALVFLLGGALVGWRRLRRWS